MDVNDKFNAKPWDPNKLREPSYNMNNQISTQIWISERDENEKKFTSQYLHKFPSGLNIIDLQLNQSSSPIDEIEIMNEVKIAFKNAKWFKPKSSRKKSIELFIIGIEFIHKPECNNNKKEINKPKEIFN